MDGLWCVCLVGIRTNLQGCRFCLPLDSATLESLKFEDFEAPNWLLCLVSEAIPNLETVFTLWIWMALSMTPSTSGCGRAVGSEPVQPWCLDQSGMGWLPCLHFFRTSHNFHSCKNAIKYFSMQLGLKTRIIHERDRTGFEETKDFPIRANSTLDQCIEVIGRWHLSGWMIPIDC